MASVNRVILIGNLGRDPETRFLPSGAAVCEFSIATSEKFKGRDGQMQERTEWHRITVFGKMAEVCGKYLEKGRPVYVEGSIRSEEYEAKDGSGKKRSYKIVAQSVQFLGARGGAPMGDDAAGFSGGGAARGRAPAQVGGGDDVAPMDDEDIPF
jgi:single-strand DNA-binding protein